VRCLEVNRSRPSDAVSPSLEADALWTDEDGAMVGVRTADCVPVLLEDPVGRRVAAVHSGWKGTIAEISRRAVEALCHAGSSPAELRAAIGPCIGRCCYAVDEGLAKRFGAEFGADVVERGERSSPLAADPQQPRLDLTQAVKLSLERAGVPIRQIDVLSVCTSCDARFFSHRRDAGKTGRQLAVIQCKFDAGL
jgi:YfiH family protein